MDRKTLYIIGAIVAILVIGAWWWSKTPVSEAPGARVPSSQQGTAGAPQDAAGAAVQPDTTGAINQDLRNITVEDSDFNSIDSDINSL